MLSCVVPSSSAANDDGNWLSYRDHALSLFPSGKFEEAEQDMLKSIELARKNFPEAVASLYSILGFTYRKQQKLSEAIAAINQGLELMRQEKNSDPVQVGILEAGLAEAYRANGQLDDSLRVSLDAKKLTASNTGALCTVLQNLGMTYARMNKPEQAAAEFKSCIQLLSPNSDANTKQVVSESMYSLALLYAKQKRINELSQLLDTAIPYCEGLRGAGSEQVVYLRKLRQLQLAGDVSVLQWFVLVDSGHRAMSLKRFPEAIENFEEAALAVNPPSVEWASTIDFWSQTLVQQGQFKRAENLLADAITKLSGGSDTNERIAQFRDTFAARLALAKAGKKEEGSAAPR